MDKRKIEYQKAVHWNVKDLNIFFSPNSMQLLQGTWGQQISFEKKNNKEINLPVLSLGLCQALTNSSQFSLSLHIICLNYY